MIKELIKEVFTKVFSFTTIFSTIFSTFFNKSKIYIYLILLLGGISLLSYGYYKYTNMASTIKNQEIIIENKQKEIKVQNDNLKKLEVKLINEVSKVKAETLIKAKQKEIEKETNYDKSNSREITSTYIDLP